MLSWRRLSRDRLKTNTKFENSKLLNFVFLNLCPKFKSVPGRPISHYCSTCSVSTSKAIWKLEILEESKGPTWQKLFGKLLVSNKKTQERILSNSNISQRKRRPKFHSHLPLLGWKVCSISSE